MADQQLLQVLNQDKLLDLIGTILKNQETHYQDMRNFANSYSDLAIQLMNFQHQTQILRQPITTQNVEQEEEEVEDFPDLGLLGGSSR
jgi:hypothetical protein